MGLAVRKMKIVLPDPAIDAEVDPCRSEGAYSLQARLDVTPRNPDREIAQAPAHAVHQTCSLFQAMRGNVDVMIRLS